MSKSSKYWQFGSTATQDIKRLEKEKAKLDKELAEIRGKDIWKVKQERKRRELQENISRAKKEKFYRTPTGQRFAKLQGFGRATGKATGSAFRAAGEQAKSAGEKFQKAWDSPEERRARKRLGKDFIKFYKSIRG